MSKAVKELTKEIAKLEKALIINNEKVSRLKSVNAMISADLKKLKANLKTAQAEAKATAKAVAKEKKAKK